MPETILSTAKNTTKHLVSIKDLKRDDFDRLMKLAHDAEHGKLINSLSDKIIASCFFEASTRTRLSFEAAIHRLGAKVIGFADAHNTSFGQKGESLSDTIQMLNGYADAIVMRHFEAGSAEIAANVSHIPVVNAGDGANEHPSQTLLDLFTIEQKFGKIDGVKIAMIGDLRYGRTVHSLSYALLNYRDITIYYVAPQALQIPEEILTQLKKKNITVHCVESLADVIGVVDVLYMTRLQKERFSEEDGHTMDYVLTADMLINGAHDDLIVMHPLPRVQEICNSVDSTQYAWYFQQAKNGVFMRQAILYNLLKV
ncbi:aspartate carbamoyltransferase [Cysteiniphilum sp. 6C5]|uniref:aspartate carbamoyltransferase n=1 Tax=unclassified Cysteiniphilum TaxID=2610889 RepID=UPI003F83452A